MSKSNGDSHAARAAKLSTATLSDALDKLGIQGQCHKIMPCDPKFRLTGRAYTVLYGPASTPPGTVGDYIDDVKPGDAVVIANGGREDVSTWGNLLTMFSHRHGIAGTVIDGICRDVALCRDLGYPIFSRGNWMRTGKSRIQVEGLNVPVNIGGARVKPGDLICGDADGVVVIPHEHQHRVLEIAESIQKVEDAIRECIREGMRLDEARKRYSYHQLQDPD